MQAQFAFGLIELWLQLTANCLIHILLPATAAAAPHSHLNRYRGSRSGSGSITQRPLAGQNSTIECAREKSINRQTDGPGKERKRKGSRQREMYVAVRKTARQGERERKSERGKAEAAMQIDRGIDKKIDR